MSGRMMAFVDGENLVCRFQTMQEGKTSSDQVVHQQDVFVWHPHFLTNARTRGFRVLRINYYTSLVGDDNKMEQIRSKLRSCRSSICPCAVTPVLFKRSRGQRSSKGVDIKLTTDLLTHVYQDNVEAVYLLSGDGDYIPLIEEVKRKGLFLPKAPWPHRGQRTVRS
jgi:uncharacterized LabA/DUF88 family protein